MILGFSQKHEAFSQIFLVILIVCEHYVVGGAPVPHVVEVTDVAASIHFVFLLSLSIANYRTSALF